jgi:hypothetical protein
MFAGECALAGVALWARAVLKVGRMKKQSGSQLPKRDDSVPSGSVLVLCGQCNAEIGDRDNLQITASCR